MPQFHSFSPQNDELAAPKRRAALAACKTLGNSGRPLCSAVKGRVNGQELYQVCIDSLLLCTTRNKGAEAGRPPR